MDEFATAFLNVFRSHRLDPRPGAPIDSLTLDDAYAVQRAVVDQRVSEGESVAGYKVGCTSAAIRDQFGLAEPIRGHVMHPHVHSGHSVLDISTFHQPAVEPEFVLSMARDLVNEVGSDECLVDAIEWVSPGIEVHNFDWWFGDPTQQELVCSNGIHACLVVGEERYDPADIDWDMEGVGLFRNGELAASGIGAEIMGGPMNSLRWLVNHLVRRGDALRAGQIVIPGSAVRLVPVEAGDRIEARFTHFGSVVAEFTGDPNARA